MADLSDGFPKGARRPAPDGIVQVLMTEAMARSFERKCLGAGNTVGDTHLEGPLLFGPDDLPTYIIGIREPVGVPSEGER